MQEWMRTSLQTVYACRYMSVAAHSCLDHGVLPYSLTVFVCVCVLANMRTFLDMTVMVLGF